MATSMSEAVAAAISRTVKGVEYRFSPLTLGAFGELEQWARQKVITLARDAAMTMLEQRASEIMQDALAQLPDDADEAWRVAKRKINSLGSDLITEAMREVMALLMKEAFHKATTICFMASAGDDPLAKEATTSLMSSVDGAIQMLWFSARRNHPNISKKEIERLLDDPSTDMKSLLEDVMKASGQEPFRVGEIERRGASQGSSPAPIPITPRREGAAAK